MPASVWVIIGSLFGGGLGYCGFHVQKWYKKLTPEEQAEWRKKAWARTRNTISKAIE
ncbi:hypothetical protein Bwad002_22310 [Bilophila wadsworthia]